MAKTKKGKKWVHVREHTKSSGTSVRRHIRSTPNPRKTNVIDEPGNFWARLFRKRR